MNGQMDILFYQFWASKSDLHHPVNDTKVSYGYNVLDFEPWWRNVTFVLSFALP